MLTRAEVAELVEKERADSKESGLAWTPFRFAYPAELDARHYCDVGGCCHQPTRISYATDGPGSIVVCQACAFEGEAAAAKAAGRGRD